MKETYFIARSITFSKKNGDVGDQVKVAFLKRSIFMASLPKDSHFQ